MYTPPIPWKSWACYARPSTTMIPGANFRQNVGAGTEEFGTGEFGIGEGGLGRVTYNWETGTGSLKEWTWGGDFLLLESYLCLKNMSFFLLYTFLGEGNFCLGVGAMRLLLAGYFIFIDVIHCVIIYHVVLLPVGCTLHI